MRSSRLTGVGTPSSTPRRTTYPLRWAISVGRPRARSCAVEERWPGIEPASDSTWARASGGRSIPSARATARHSATTSASTPDGPATPSPQQAPESDKLAKAAAAATGDARAAAYQAFQKQGNIDGPFIPLIQPAQIVVTSNTLNNVVVNPVTTLEFATIS